MRLSSIMSNHILKTQWWVQHYVLREVVAMSDCSHCKTIYFFCRDKSFPSATCTHCPSSSPCGSLWRKNLTVSYLNCGDQNWSQHPRCSLISMELSGMITFLALLVTSLQVQPRNWFVFSAAALHAWPMFNLSTRTPMSLSASVLQSHMDPRL